ncbi:MAG TPA: NADP-dependent oxidoreductase [Nitrososphaeraceae archaeon]|nr:NADP-dependent oxidoreductase [Nitrososphaeraceae archaeon]
MSTSTNNQIVSKEIRLKERPSGLITEENFELVEVKVQEPGQGEFLVQNLWISVDPHMRIYLTKGTKLSPALPLNKPPISGCIGQIIESKNNKYKVGEYVLGNSGWREYWISNGNSNNNTLDDVVKIDSKIAPIQHFLGILGITGFTAYIGLLKIGELRQNSDIVYVSAAAAGGVGSIACQIAKIQGCTVIGSAGNDDKVEWLINTLKIDDAFNYKKKENEDQTNYYNNSISSKLKKLCPNGIDLYFDNIGGHHLEAAIYNMNIFGRIVLCGATSQYNLINDDLNNKKEDPYLLSLPVGPTNLNLAISHRLKLQGFLFNDHYDILDEFRSKMSKWIKENRLKWKETVYEGLECAPKAFIELFKGGNIGKTLVKI